IPTLRSSRAVPGTSPTAAPSEPRCATGVPPRGNPCRPSSRLYRRGPRPGKEKASTTARAAPVAKARRMNLQRVTRSTAPPLDDIENQFHSCDRCGMADVWRLVPLAGVLVFFGLGIGLRAWLHARRHGSSGIVLFRGNAPSERLLGAVGVVVPAALLAQATVAAIAPDLAQPDLRLHVRRVRRVRRAAPHLAASRDPRGWGDRLAPLGRPGGGSAPARDLRGRLPRLRRAGGSVPARGGPAALKGALRSN